MDTSWRWAAGLSRRDVGAGVVAAVAALVASVLSLPLLTVESLAPSVDARYWFGYAPPFATVAGLVVGTVAWRRLVSRASTPRRGALAGVATGLGTVLLVPVLAGLYVVAFPVLLGLVTGTASGQVLRVLPGYVEAFPGVVRAVAVGWSPLVGAILLPLGGVAGWAYQRVRPAGEP
jgi:hypothetical protein